MKLVVLINKDIVELNTLFLNIILITNMKQRF